MRLFDASGRPLSTSRDAPRASHDAGAFRGSLSGWRGPRVSGHTGAAREREVMQRRAADLIANDFSANAAVDTITSNAVGTGLLPKPAIPAQRLGITPEQAREVGASMEWAFAAWMREADATGRCCFFDLQALGLRSVLSMGELLHVAVMLPESERRASGRRFSLALQALSPSRLQTPADLTTDPHVRDGIRYTAWGRPEGYYVACPPAMPGGLGGLTESPLLPSDFRYLPARGGHRRNVEPGVCLLLILTNGGAHALTWGMAPRWPNGEAPSLTADGTDLVTLLRAPDGWYGVHAAAACA